MEPNLPELPTAEVSDINTSSFHESKVKETLQDNLRFFKSLFYLTRKIFML